MSRRRHRPPSAAAPHGRRAGTTAAPAAGSCSPWSSLLALVMLRAVRASSLLNAFKSPGRLRARRPAQPADEPLPRRHHGPSGSAVDFGRKLWNSVFISGTRSRCSRVLLSVLNAYALGIGRVTGPALDRRCSSCWPTCCRRRRWSTRCTTCSKQVGLYDTRLGGDHHLHRHPERVRHRTCCRRCSAPFPTRGARGGGAGRREPAGGSCGGSSCPICGRPSAVLLDLLLHLDLERVPHPADHPRSPTSTRPCRSRWPSLQGDRLMDATTTSASALLGIIPALLFFLIFQRTLTARHHREEQPSRAHEVHRRVLAAATRRRGAAPGRGRRRRVERDDAVFTVYAPTRPDHQPRRHPQPARWSRSGSSRPADGVIGVTHRPPPRRACREQPAFALAAGDGPPGSAVDVTRRCPPRSTAGRR